LNILVAPLNWGLGHASRCIPIIRQLIQDGHTPVLASDGQALIFLKRAFPDLITITLPGYKIRYSPNKSQVWAILKSLPAIIQASVQEHRLLKKIVKKHQIERIISDNRFGLWHREICSIYITHQLMIKMPKGFKFLEKTVWRLHRWIINQYDACHIPDYEGIDNLSGDLSHLYPLPKNARFMGPLSRFKLSDVGFVAKPLKEYHTVAIISGPEPQRSIFEKEIIAQYKDGRACILIIQGKPENAEKGKVRIQTLNNIAADIDIVPHLDDAEFKAHLLAASKIICRAGYSTIMDLHAIGCLHKAEFIPTPGQTEQEYLADYHHKKGEAFFELSPSIN
jgi:uncharacterized protein (TIGR00661 family)